MIEQYKGHDLLWHDGSFGTLVSFMPQDNIGIAIAANKADPMAWIIAYTIYDRLLDLKPTRWHERWKGKAT